MERIHLVVLFGGQSAEHDVSCVTATHVLRAIDPARYRVTPIGISTEGHWALAESAREALTAGALPERLDPNGSSVSPSAALSAVDHEAGEQTVVLPLLHGPMGEDGTVQGLLELADVAYVGAGVLGSALSMDKAMAKQVLAANGIPQARYRAFADHERTPGLQAVVGREIEVAVIGGVAPEASGAGEIVPGAEFYDYEDKYVTDGAQLLIPAPLTAVQTDDVRDLAVRVFRALRADGLARVDFFLEEHGRGFLCNEINTMPGFTPISMYPKLWQAAGVTYPDLIDRLVALALERHGRRRRNTKH